MQKDKEDIEEVSTELELADEDELVPYKVGDSFNSIPLPDAQELLSENTTEVEEEVTKLEEQLDGMKAQMSELKAYLYARFGKGINLES